MTTRGRFEPREVLAHRLARQSQVCAELAQSLAVVRVQPVQQLPAARIGKRLEHRVHVLDHDLINIMQEKGDMSSATRRRGSDISRVESGIQRLWPAAVGGPPKEQTLQNCPPSLCRRRRCGPEWLGGISAIF